MVLPQAKPWLLHSWEDLRSGLRSPLVSESPCLGHQIGRSMQVGAVFSPAASYALVSKHCSVENQGSFLLNMTDEI